MTTTTRERADVGAIVANPIPLGGFLSDYQDAVQSYIDDYVTITIDRVTFPGDVLNVGEVGNYEVVIFNGGMLRMCNVSVRFRGLNGTTVKGGGAAAVYEPEWVFEDMIEKIGPGKSSRIGTGSDNDKYQILSFTAPETALSKRELLEVVIEDFDADFDPVHNRDNGGGSGTWSKRVAGA